MKKTILIIDDSPSIRQMVQFTLTQAGYEVVEASNGLEGLEKARTSRCNAILTDQNMPEMDGLTMIRHLRQLSLHKATPILVLTTETSDSLKQQGRAAGATGWLTKPFDPTKLVEVIEKVTGLQ